jgi:hypothetical protein
METELTPEHLKREVVHLFARIRGDVRGKVRLLYS